MDILLYEGNVVLSYDEKEHVYRYNGDVVPSVTSAIEVIDKPFLIPWALNMAEQYINEKIKEEGLSKFSLSPAISPNKVAVWAADMKKKYRTVFKKAGEIGTEVHKWVEDHIKSVIESGVRPLPASPTSPEVESAVKAFLEWESVNHVEYLVSERKVFSVKHKYAGTLDVIANINGVKTLLDFKTSNYYSDNYALQTAAYRMAYNEELEKERIDNRVVIMLSKETGMPTVIEQPESSYETECSTFLSALNIYQWKKSLPQRS